MTAMHCFNFRANNLNDFHAISPLIKHMLYGKFLEFSFLISLYCIALQLLENCASLT